MESGPLPPHERSWRHPSEVAAAARAVEAQEIASPVARNAALLGAAASMAVVALLVMVVTPSRGGAPIAVSSTTAPTIPTAASAGPTIGASPVALVLADGVAEALPRATPIAGTDLAVVTRQALASVAVARWSAPTIGGEARVSSDQLEVATPVGTAIVAVVDEQPDDDVVIVELVEPQHDSAAIALAERAPTARERVKVMAEEPVEVAFDELDTLDVPEGTAVLDRNGKLVGLCGGRGGRTTLLTLDGWSVEDAAEGAERTPTRRPAEASASLDD